VEEKDECAALLEEGRDCLICTLNGRDCLIGALNSRDCLICALICALHLAVTVLCVSCTRRMERGGEGRVSTQHLSTTMHPGVKRSCLPS